MNIQEVIVSLAKLQFQYNSDSAAQRVKLIKRAEALPLQNAEDIIAFHDRLLCMLVYPDNALVYETAHNALKNLAAKTVAFMEKAGESAIWKLTQSAIAESSINSTYSYALTRWLVHTFPDQITYSGCEASKEIITRVFSQILPAAVGESLFDNHEHSLEQLAKKACGSSASVDLLHWTITQFDAATIPNKSKEQLFEMLALYITWHTNSTSPTKTFGRFNGSKRYFFQSNSIIHHVDFQKILADTTLRPIQLSANEKKQLCDLAKGVLCSHYREIDPITYCDEKETELYDAGRGITIALYYLLPGWRLPLESYVSYMAFRNGVPLSYGGGWMFFNRAKLAGNIFPAFRGGESALLFAQVYRLYHLRFGATCFQVAPYQIGQKNEDAIKSGAFWFYHRLGFRPENKTLLQLAEEEDSKRKADKKYRSSSAVLRQFAHAEIQLSLEQKVHVSHKAVLEKMNCFVAQNYGGNYAAYFAKCKASLQKACKKHRVSMSKDLLSDPLAEHLCGLLHMFTEYSKWSKVDLRKLTFAMQEKVYGSEHKFLDLLSSIKRLKNDLGQLN